jgi:hypothetical protein
MMTVQETEDVRVAVRFPRWLYEDIEKCAELSGWDVSKQIRWELLKNRGKAPMPHFPQSPSSDRAPRKGA